MTESGSRVVRVLQSFRASERNLALADIAARADLPKSSTHRVLATLLAHGLVERDPASRRYRLGIRLFELGSIAVQQRGLQSAAGPALEKLSMASGETCHLAVLSGTDAVYVAKLDGPASVIMSSRVGGRAPCHATSIGKVLAAWAPASVLDDLSRLRMRAYTPRTIKSWARLQQELETVRAAGYALDLEEFEDGLRCIAAPIRDHTGDVLAAIGIAGPARRLLDETLAAHAATVVDTANAVSRELGYSGMPAR